MKRKEYEAFGFRPIGSTPPQLARKDENVPALQKEGRAREREGREQRVLNDF
jgi:hypothetical protein